ncbi:type VI secretion system baseplate subunit TssK [Caulobacter segnis]
MAGRRSCATWTPCPAFTPSAAYETFSRHGWRIGDPDPSHDRRPPSFPDYVHEKLQPTFEPVFEALQAALSAVFDRSAIQLPLQVAGPGAYTSRITDHNLYKSGFFYLAVNARASLDDIRGRLPSVAKIGPVQKMREIVDSALPGVPLRHTPPRRPQLRVIPGYVYFELDRSVADWRRLRQRRRAGPATWPATGPT